MLVGLSALVLVSDVIAGVAPGIGVMLAARAVLGIGVGGFWVFGAGAAISLVSEQETAHNDHADVAVRGHTEAASRKELPCPTQL